MEQYTLSAAELLTSVVSSVLEADHLFVACSRSRHLAIRRQQKVDDSLPINPNKQQNLFDRYLRLGYWSRLLAGLLERPFRLDTVVYDLGFDAIHPLSQIRVAVTTLQQHITGNAIWCTVYFSSPA